MLKTVKITFIAGDMYSRGAQYKLNMATTSNLTGNAANHCTVDPRKSDPL